MSHPNKHIDDLQTRLNQARLVQQRNNHASSFSFPRFVASLRAALKNIRKQDKQDPRELVCEFADAIPGFNEMLKTMNIEKVSHLGSDLFEIVSPGGHAGVPLLDPMRQVVSIHGKVLLEGYNYIHCCCSDKGSGYFQLYPDHVYTAKLVQYDQQGVCFKTLVDRDQGYDGFVVMPGHNCIITSKQEDGVFVRGELQLDTLQPTPPKETADEKKTSGKGDSFMHWYYRNRFGIPGKHIVRAAGDDKRHALFAIDPTTKKQKRVTDRHQRILDTQDNDGTCIYAFDTHEDNSVDVFVYSIYGTLLRKRHYGPELGRDARSAFKPLPYDLHTELDNTQQHADLEQSKIPSDKIMCDKKGKKVEGLRFRHISESGLGTTQSIWIPNKEHKFQHGLYSLEKQYRIIPPIMSDEIQFKLGVAVLRSADGVRVVKAEDILECENKGISYQ